MVDIRFSHHIKKLPGIGRQAFDIAALTLGIDGVKGEAGFSRSGQTGDHHQLVARDLDIHTFEVVLARAAHLDELLFGHEPPLI